MGAVLVELAGALLAAVTGLELAVEVGALLAGVLGLAVLRCVSGGFLGVGRIAVLPAIDPAAHDVSVFVCEEIVVGRGG